MRYAKFVAERNADGSYSVSIDGSKYRVQDMVELIHFLENDSYEGIKAEKHDNKRNSH